MYGGVVQSAGLNRCRGGPHTYDDGYAGPGHLARFLEVNGWAARARRVATWEYVDQNGHAQDNGRWCLERAAGGGWYLRPAYAYRQNGRPDLCLDVLSGHDAAASRPRQVWSCNGRLNQRFGFKAGNRTGGRIYAMGSRTYVLRGHHDRARGPSVLQVGGGRAGRRRWRGAGARVAGSAARRTTGTGREVTGQGRR
ncbi:RICIN domain-containing protein [Kitasatospora cheerisanensis]|uniref:RICIN domain-containing protein n=1 Tax=Kitasatospora cheerisanensis TaxID=81942 RepID=UPI00056060A8|nr:hypothetical protein [Kitasatospora cheerisanensis]